MRNGNFQSYDVIFITQRVLVIKVAMVSYQENIGSGRQVGKNSPPDQTGLEADNQAVFKQVKQHIFHVHLCFNV